MYTAKYVVKTTRTPEGEKEQRTVLKVKLRFGEEVPKISLANVNRRLKYWKPDTQASNVYNFLCESEGLKFSGEQMIAAFTQYSYVFCEEAHGTHDDKRVIHVSPPFWPVLGINIFGIGKGHVPLEEMLDLEALNDFILHGHYKLKGRKK